jgi:hypothetical protein
MFRSLALLVFTSLKAHEAELVDDAAVLSNTPAADHSVAEFAVPATAPEGTASVQTAYSPPPYEIAVVGTINFCFGLPLKISAMSLVQPLFQGILPSLGGNSRTGLFMAM